MKNNRWFRRIKWLRRAKGFWITARKVWDRREVFEGLRDVRLPAKKLSVLKVRRLVHRKIRRK
ncbi:hypothetical protein ABXS75_12490 [Roseburia hominis]